VEKYGDLITNGLDLVSFLLVTPEIMRVIAPAVNKLIGLVIASLFAGFGMMVVYVSGLWHNQPWLLPVGFLFYLLIFWKAKYVKYVFGLLARLLERFAKLLNSRLSKSELSVVTAFNGLDSTWANL
jgi:hypothetical protein